MDKREEIKKALGKFLQMNQRGEVCSIGIVLRHKDGTETIKIGGITQAVMFSAIKEDFFNSADELNVSN